MGADRARDRCADRVTAPVLYAAGIAEFLAALRTRMADMPASRDPSARRDRFEHYARRFDLAMPEGIAAHDAFVTACGREIPLRLYRPVACEGATPTALYLHGGGFVTGSIASYHALAANLAAWSGLQVALLHYRRAPENPHPAALDDVMVALDWLLKGGAGEGVDVDRLALAGESAGATLALSAAMAVRDRGGPRIAALGMLCPGPLASQTGPAWIATHGRDPVLKTDDIAYYIDAYLGRNARPCPAAFPLDGASLAGLPPSMIHLAEHDPLRPQGEALAAAMREAGIVVHEFLASGMIHSLLRAASMGGAALAEAELFSRRLGELVRNGGEAGEPRIKDRRRRTLDM